MKKVIIWGNNGFVGKYLSREMKKSGYYVIGSDLGATCNDSNVDEYYPGSILNMDEVAGLVRDKMAEYIVNLAGMSSVGMSWKMPQKAFEINTIGAVNILEAVRNYSSGAKILLVGSSEEYAPSTESLNEESPLNGNSPYSISKISQEMYAEMYRREYGVNVICTRTFNHTGVGQDTRFVLPSFVSQVIKGEESAIPETEMLVGNLEICRDFGNVRDMVEAYRILLENDNREHIYNVGNGTCVRLRDILDYIIGKSSKKVVVTVDPARLRPDDNMVVWCDNSRMREEYGWCPKYTIFDTIDEMVDELRS